MIHHLDNLLNKLLERPDVAEIGFQPPDETWRKHVASSEGNRLNVHLADIRENRTLRSNERFRRVDGGLIQETPAPRRIDCHYLITAWSPGDDTEQVQFTIDQHQLLYEVARTLMNSEPLIPERVFNGNPPAGFPTEILNAELPTTILPVEGFPNYGEFWSSFNWYWKPGVYAIVTLPVIAEESKGGEVVTTHVIKYDYNRAMKNGRKLIEIGGVVLDSENLHEDGEPTPVVGVEVQLFTKKKQTIIQTTSTDTNGRFTFTDLPELSKDEYRVKALEKEQSIQVRRGKAKVSK